MVCLRACGTEDECVRITVYLVDLRTDGGYVSGCVLTAIYDGCMCVVKLAC